MAKRFSDFALLDASESALLAFHNSRLSPTLHDTRERIISEKESTPTLKENAMTRLLHRRSCIKVYTRGCSAVMMDSFKAKMRVKMGQLTSI